MELRPALADDDAPCLDVLVAVDLDAEALRVRGWRVSLAALRPPPRPALRPPPPRTLALLSRPLRVLPLPFLCAISTAGIRRATAPNEEGRALATRVPAMADDEESIAAMVGENEFSITKEPCVVPRAPSPSSTGTLQ